MLPRQHQGAGNARVASSEGGVDRMENVGNEGAISGNDLTSRGRWALLHVQEAAGQRVLVSQVAEGVRVVFRVEVLPDGPGE